MEIFALLVQKVDIGAASYNVHYDHYHEFWSLVSARQWEPEMVGLIEQLVRPTTLFFDIGTWMGPTALMAAALGAETYAFEPDPIAYRRFIRNLGLNPTLRPLIHPFNAACGRQDGIITLYADALGNSETSVLETRNHALDLSTAEADALDLNDLLKSLRVRSRETFFKIDIEGAEFDLVPHIAETVRSMPHAVINISTHPTNLKNENTNLQVHARREAKENILNALAGLRWYRWKDPGVLTEIDEETVRREALDNVEAPDVLTAASYDVLNSPPF